MSRWRDKISKLLRIALLYWLPACVWMGVIYSISAESNPYRMLPDAHLPPAAATLVPRAVTTPAPRATAHRVTATACPACTPVRPRPTARVAAVPPAPKVKDVPTTPLRPGYEALGRLAHGCEYALLGILLARGLTGAGIAPRRRGWRVFFLALAFLLASGFGLGDELHQTRVAGRTYQDVDLILDVLGAAAGVLIFARWRGGVSRRRARAA